METALKDLRYAFRVFFKHPVFTLVIVLSIALAIGANTTIFTFINALFFPTVPVEDPDRLVGLYTLVDDSEDLAGVSHENYVDFAKDNETFSGIAAYWNIPLTLEREEGSEFVWGEMVSANFFDVLGVPATHGRTFLPEEGATPGTHYVIVMGHDFWQKHFDGDPSIVGTKVPISNHQFEVVGIAPEGFAGVNLMENPDIWIPTMMVAEVLSEGMLDMFLNRRENVFNSVGRLSPGVTMAEAEADLRAMVEKTKNDPDLFHFNKGRDITLRPFSEALIDPEMREELRSASWLLMAIVVLVLFIACANVANLLLIRANRRRSEIAVRQSMGAGKGRLIRQLLTESVALSLLGGVLGLLLAVWARKALWGWTAPFLPFTLNVPLDTPVLAFTFTLSVLTGILFGIVPALRASKTDITHALKEQNVSVPSRGRPNLGLGNSLVIVQVALSLVVLVVAGLFIRTLWNLQSKDPGFETEKLALISFNELAGLGYDDDTGPEYLNKVRERAESLPGVEAAAITSYMPLVDGGGISTIYLKDGHLHRTAGAKVEPSYVLSASVSVDYFKTMGIPLIRGRTFVPEDVDALGDLEMGLGPDAPPVPVVVSESMKTRFWTDEEDMIGQRFHVFGLDLTPFQVVGIVGDVKYRRLGEKPKAYLYFGPYHYRSVASLYARTTGNPEDQLEALKTAIKDVDPKVPLVNAVTIKEVMDQALWAPRLSAFLLALFGLLALSLAVIGAYGVTTYLVTQRHYEIGVRMAMGARRSDVVRQFVRQSLVAVLIGVVIGTVIALVTTQSMAKFLHGVGAKDPITFVLTALLLVLVALGAVFISTRRATTVDPMVVLRHE